MHQRETKARYTGSPLDSQTCSRYSLSCNERSVARVTQTTYYNDGWRGLLVKKHKDGSIVARHAQDSL